MLVDFDLIIKATKEDKLGWESQKGYKYWVSDELIFNRYLCFYEEDNRLFYCSTLESIYDPMKMMEFESKFYSLDDKAGQLKTEIKNSIHRKEQREKIHEENKFIAEMEKIKERGFVSDNYWHYGREKGDECVNDKE